MQRLNPIDVAFLDLESEDVQANIGGVSFFEGPAPSHDELCARIDSKLPLTPRYRQRLKFIPGNLNRPIWIDDTEFEIANHLIHRRLPGGTFEDVCRLYGDMVSTHLDRARPLWQLWAVDGLADGEWAIFWKVHHALVDGVAASDVMNLLLDVEPDPPPAPPDEWVPQSEPGATRILLESVSGALRPANHLGSIGRAIRNPLRTTRTVASAFSTVLPAKRLIGPQSDTALNGQIGPLRDWQGTQADLAEIKTIGKAFGGTVNDVVLAAVTAGIEHFLIERGEDLNSVTTRVMVPVSMRTEDERGECRNLVSAVFVELPFGLEDPVAKLHDLRGQMAHYKETDGARAGEVVTNLADYAPPMLFALGERIVWRVAGAKRLMNTVATNIPGPQFPLYCLGRRMTRIFPYVMLAKDIRVAMAIFSYDGGVYFGVSGDRESVPDLSNVCAGIDAGIAELSRAAKSAKGNLRAIN